MAYGVNLKHLEVDKITWSFSKKRVPPLRGALIALSTGEGRGVLFLTGAENTAKYKYICCLPGDPTVLISWRSMSN
jgi:hypothetical protein